MQHDRHKIAVMNEHVYAHGAVKGMRLVRSTFMRLVFALCEILLENFVIAGTDAGSGAI